MRECAPCSRESSGPRSRVRTKNADIEYRELITEDPVKAYSCMCLCQPPFTKAEEEEEEEGGVNPREGKSDGSKRSCGRSRPTNTQITRGI